MTEFNWQSFLDERTLLDHGNAHLRKIGRKAPILPPCNWGMRCNDVHLCPLCLASLGCRIHALTSLPLFKSWNWFQVELSLEAWARPMGNRRPITGLNAPGVRDFCQWLFRETRKGPYYRPTFINAWMHARLTENAWSVSKKSFYLTILVGPLTAEKRVRVMGSAPYIVRKNGGGSITFPETKSLLIASPYFKTTHAGKILSLRSDELAELACNLDYSRDRGSALITRGMDL